MSVHVLSDDDAVRDSLDLLLQANDVPAQTYDSPDALMREVVAKPIGCILLDLTRKSENPLELLSRLRARGVSLLVIILVSDLPAPRVKQPDTIMLRKPVEPKDLIEAVRQECSLSPN